MRTGKLRWTFHTIPRPGEAGHETWPAEAWRTAGGANAWAGMVVDEKRGIVFAPTGSTAYDFFGGDRLGNNLYANSLIALDANTGKRLWHFQAVHHDIWDRDFPSPPVLLTVRHNGKMVDAVAQATKQGFLFVFDRVTGKPLFPIEERPVPASDVPGEKAAPTQPFALKPEPFARQLLTEDMLTTRTPEARAAVLSRFREMRSAGLFVPFALDKQTVVFPGFDGGAEWGGQAVDPSGVIYINGTDVPYYSGLRPNKTTSATPLGERIYVEQCSGCHGVDRQGTPPQMPTVVGVQFRRERPQVDALIQSGTGRMPGFPQLSAEERASVIDYLMGASRMGDSDLHSLIGDMRGLPYLFSNYNRFNDPDGYPAVKPPWGTLSAIDLNTGEYRWRVPLGEYPALVAQGVLGTGSENYGGPLVTRSGLVIIAATVFDRKMRAFDSRNGALLWQTELPYTGLATPITYMIDGRQYVLIATSGGRDPKGPKGSAYVAFSLPSR
ncbi:PQQ-binding-like beta-propeller repeat protein [Novosphingobium sp. G106]|uniref:c-type cytochrome n=1 Tax=Novosphingobium sp. G106 TaxID=2849500 RepID=UPI001C2DD9DE|nr:PQQ-binding-like beta-propeller repeat protein [Novosphingobium sp. G106]MBV1686356.1 PQQ-binding-like beta-propeller repeat protein [Novosphingobium sp. G106]